MSAVLMLIVSAAVAAGPGPMAKGPAVAPSAKAPTEAPRPSCASFDPRNIVVCGEREQPYRVDPNVMEAEHEAQSNSRSATSAMPPAQMSCATSKRGCTKDLSSLDFANVAIVAATSVAKAAKGDDWTRAFRTGGPDEYQLYQQAKQRREAEAKERAAARVKREAEAEEAATQAATPPAN